MAIGSWTLITSWLAVTVALFWCMLRLFASPHIKSLSERATYAITLAIGLIVVVTQWLGIAGLLRPGILVLSVGFLLAITFFMQSRVTLASLRVVRQSQENDDASTITYSAPKANSTAVAIISVLLTAILASWGCTFGLFGIPQNWDTISYHLLFVDNWLSTQQLYTPSLTKWFFPANAEILNLWFAMTQPTNASAPLASLVGAALISTSGFAILTRAGFAPFPSIFAIAVGLLNPIVFVHLASCKNDVLCAGLLLASMLSLARFQEAGRKVDLYIFATAVGIAVGSKFYCFGYVAVIWFAHVMLSLVRRQFALIPQTAIAGALGTMAFSGIWYLRNLWIVGAPFYPSGILALPSAELPRSEHLFRTSLFGSSVENRWFVWLDAVWPMIGDAAPFAIIGMLLFVASLGAELLRSRKQRESTDSPTTQVLAIRTFVSLIAFGSFVVYGITPFVVGVTESSSVFLQNGFVAIRLGWFWFTLLLLFGIAYLLQFVENQLHAAMRHIVTVTALVWIAFQSDYRKQFEPVQSLLDGFFMAPAIPWLTTFVALFLLLLPWAWLYRLESPRAIGARLALVAVTGLFAITTISMASIRFKDEFGATYDRLFGTRLFSELQINNQFFHDTESVWICSLTARSQPLAGPVRQYLVASAHDICAIPVRFDGADKLAQYLRLYPFTHLVVDEQDDNTRGMFLRLLEREPEFASRMWSDGVFTIYSLNERIRQ